MMDPATLVAATLAVMTGAIVQSVSGVGGGFIVVPLLALVDIRLVPGPVVFASLALSCTMAWAERGHMDMARLPAIMAGIVPGCAFSAWALTGVPAGRLGMVFGALVLLGVLVTASGVHIPFSRRSAFITGAVSGAMGTAAGFGAPALALLFQNQAGPRVRATLALIYTLASLAILAMLGLFGHFHAGDAIAGALIMPGNLLGWLLARRLTVHVDHERSRLVVLGVSALAALSLMARSL